jgi:hypothetical protein
MEEHSIHLAELFLKIMGVSGAIIIFLIGLFRYRKDQTWRRQEFIAKEIKEFQNDSAVKNVMLMLDWEIRYVLLFPDRPIVENRYVRVDADLFLSSLATSPQNLKNNRAYYKEEEVAIRDSIDIFLGYLDKFNVYITATLISKSEIFPYLKYWIETINERIPKENRQALFDYISMYGFDGAEKILMQE